MVEQAAIFAFREWVQEKVIEQGLVEVYKPYGVPSTALVEMYKRVTGKKVGHGGTLDPLAEGALMLGIGPGTKLLSKYLASEKRYRATMLFGAKSFSGDLELPLEIDESSGEMDLDKIPEILAELRRGYVQELPILSAVKHQGKTSYELARAGKTVETKKVETKVLESTITKMVSLNKESLKGYIDLRLSTLQKSFVQFEEQGKLLDYRAAKYSFMIEKWRESMTASMNQIQQSRRKHMFGLLELEVLVPKGMYIRSLVSDIATRLGTIGVLTSLARISARSVDTPHHS